MTKDQVRFLVSGLLFGFLVGYIIAFAIHEPRVVETAAPVPAAGNLGMAGEIGGMPPAGAPAGMGGGSDAMMGQVFQEVAALKEAVQKDPKNVRALTRLANLFHDAGKWEDAITHYRQALALRPDDVNARTDMGICLRELGRPDEAIAEFRTSLKNDPRHWQSWLNLAVVALFDKNDTKTAAEALARVEELNPSYKDLEALKKSLRQAGGNP